MIGKWEAFLYDKSNVFVAEIPMDTLSVNLVLNDIWTAQIYVDYAIFQSKMVAQGTNVNDVLSAGFRWVDIKRDGTTIFRGILNEPNINQSGNNITLDLPFKSWLAYFTKRYTSEVYSSTDAGEIAWGIINVAQGVTNGSIAITKGTVTATKDRDRTFDRDEIAKSIIGMSAGNIKDGYDFEISNTKVFSVASRLGSDKPAIVFDYAQILQARLIYKVGLNIVTKSIQLGNGSGSDQIVADVTSSSTYTDKWFLQEKISSNTSVLEVDTLTDKANQELTLNQDFNRVIALNVTSDVDPTSYGVGDGVTVKYLDIINALYRIKSKSFQVSQGVEIISLEFLQ